jgi:SAM-dependent methyltransferase
MNNHKHFTEANREAWNEAMPYHRIAMDAVWDKRFSDPDYVFQTEPELSELQRIGIKDKDIAHLCCNNGIELLSLKRLGAGYCCGFDISDAAIVDAKRRARMINLPVSFYQSDVYEISSEFNSRFDLVYITIGALTWLPDLRDFFAVVARLLKENGKLFIYESHPFMQVLPYDVSGKTENPVIVSDYFKEGVTIFNDGLDYYGGADYHSKDCCEFIHPLSDIFNAIIANGFHLTAFHEYEHDISNGLEWVERLSLRLPLCYILTGEIHRTNK